jgi:hypothetical protein
MIFWEWFRLRTMRERTESKAEYRMPWTSRANEEIITRGLLAMPNRAMFLHPVGVSKVSDER